MIELKFTQEQLQALVQLMDAGIRSTGINAVGSAHELLQVISEATNQQAGAGQVNEE